MTVRVFPVGLPVRVFGLLTGWSASPVLGSLDPMGTTFNKISRKWCRAGATRVAAATLALGIGVTALGAAPTVASPPEDAVKVRMQTLVDAGYPAALAAHTDTAGNVIGAAVGTRDLSTGEAPPIDGEVRIGSNTKTVVAAIIMQLVEEGKVRLDEPVVLSARVVEG